jgi:hypothetical protein
VAGGIGTNIFAGLSANANTGGNGGGDLASATYGPTASGSSGPFSPRRGQGLGFWLAVAGVGVLVLIRQSLPR